MKKIYLILLFFLALGISAAHAESEGASDSEYDQLISQLKAPVVLELFTSQSCASCPPADAILVDMVKKKNDNLIVMSCHITYWNYLHWLDSLSYDFCDLRQHGMQAVHGTYKIYTPQMVVNGESIFIGTNKDEIISAIKKAAENPIGLIELQKLDEQTITFTLPETADGQYRLWAFGYRDEVVTSMGSGENAGRTVTYAHPAITYHNLGSWDGKPASRRFTETVKGSRVDGLVMMAQKSGYGKIVAAGEIVFNKD